MEGQWEGARNVILLQNMLGVEALGLLHLEGAELAEEAEAAEVEIFEMLEMLEMVDVEAKLDLLGLLGIHGPRTTRLRLEELLWTLEGECWPVPVLELAFATELASANGTGTGTEFVPQLE